MELLSEYGLFLAKIVTVVLAIAAIAAIIVNVAQRNKRQRGELRVNNLSEQYKEMKEELAAALMDTHQQKQWHKAQKKKHKQEAKAAKAKAKLGEVVTDSKPRVWVLDFKGSMDAHEVNSLREEITAVLAAFKPQDQVVLRLKAQVAWCMVTGWRLRSCSVCVIKHSFNCYGRQSRCQRRLHDGLCGGQNCFRTVCYCGFHWGGGANAQL